MRLDKMGQNGTGWDEVGQEGSYIYIIIVGRNKNEDQT